MSSSRQRSERAYRWRLTEARSGAMASSCVVISPRRDEMSCSVGAGSGWLRCLSLLFWFLFVRGQSGQRTTAWSILSPLCLLPVSGGEKKQ